MSAPKNATKRNLVRWSFGLFLFAVVVFFVFVFLLEGLMNSFPTSIQRLFLILLIVVPTGLGSLAGVGSFFRTPRRPLASIVATLLNGLAFLYFAFLAGFAG